MTLTLAAVTGIDVSIADQALVVGLVAAAAALGAVLGAERELAQKAAGVRTHMLVAAGSAVVVAVGDLLVRGDGGAGDPSRVIHGVITGIGFLGAGAIIRHSDATIEGLTTAASLWFAAGVGATCGLGLWVVALGATALGFVVLRAVGRLEARWEASMSSSSPRHPDADPDQPD